MVCCSGVVQWCCVVCVLCSGVVQSVCCSGVVQWCCAVVLCSLCVV